MNILYTVFGNEPTNHYQAAFSIYSFLKLKDNRIKSINVITDAPEFYKHFYEDIIVTTVTQETLKEWRGEHDFFWRIKIMSILKTCYQYPSSPVVYLDTDTFLFGDISKVYFLLSNEIALMHELEGPLCNAKSNTEKRMWKQVANKHFGGIEVLSNLTMFNAGVVAIPNSKNGDEIKLALKICDDMCKNGVERRLIEQFSLSIALQIEYNLQEAKEYIAHYWSNKPEWNNAIENFLCKNYCSQLSAIEVLQAYKAFDLKSIPIVRKTRNTKKRLNALVDKFFSDRDITYLSNRS